MPYINRYFHKRDFVSPSFLSFQRRQSYRDELIGQRFYPRYVTSYAYSVLDNESPNYIQETPSNLYSSTVNTNNSSNNSYKQQQHLQQFQPSIHDSKQSMILQRYDEGQGSTMNIRAKIKAPSGTVQYCDIIDFDNQHFNIQFVPREIGEHRVSVKSGKLHVPGSPFKFFVENIESYGFQNVQVFGQGLYSGYTNETNEFMISSRDAGSGNLAVSIDGPSKAQINITDIMNGTYSIKYNISIKGDYFCSVKFNNEHIPGSPFRMTIDDKLNASTSQNVSLVSIQNHGIVVGKQSTFTVQHLGFSGGLMSAFMISPSMKKENIIIKYIGDNHFNLQIEPKETGLHFIHVLVDQINIVGSPFQIMVGEIIAQGTGLIEGKPKETSNFNIDTRFVDQKPVTVTIDGPSKVELDCIESNQGYDFSYIPKLEGDYIIAATNGNNFHAKGSPFKVNVTRDSQSQYSLQKSQFMGSISDELISYPEKVECRGEGLVRSYIGRNNQFVVDASLGGAGVLFIAVIGPSRPCEELTVRHIGNKSFQVNYFVEEYGNHYVVVRWGERNVPDSPFRVFVQ